MARDPIRDALRIAAAPALERIRNDRAAAPLALKKLFTYLLKTLFDPSVNATQAWKAVGIRDNRLRVAFKDVTEGESLRIYIERRRNETAERMVRTTRFPLTLIGIEAGYTSHNTFVEAYERVHGEKPLDTRQNAYPPPVDYQVWRRGWRAELEDEASWDVLVKWLRTYPRHEERLRQYLGVADGERPVVVSGARYEEGEALLMWRDIRAQPYEEQERQVRRRTFESTALFDLLREKSRTEGRKDRRRGIEPAKLALVSLERSDDVFGERIHDLRALGWAWLGNAYVLALDFSAAEAAFENADAEWGAVRERKDQLVLARLCLFKGALRTFQRSFDEALRLLNRSCRLFRLSGETRSEAEALAQRAMAYDYSGKPREAIEDLQEAVKLVDQNEDHYLACTVRGNLANVLARAGRYRSASEVLLEARQLYRGLKHPLGAHALEWNDGFIREGQGNLQAAERSYWKAREGFAATGAWNWFAVISVDLMIVLASQDRWPDTLSLASESLSILESLKLHQESIAAVTVFAQAVAAHHLSGDALRRLRECLQGDPLILLQ